MTKAGDKILAGTETVLAFARGDKSKGRVHIIFNTKVDVKVLCQRQF